MNQRSISKKSITEDRTDFSFSVILRLSGLIEKVLTLVLLTWNTLMAITVGFLNTFREMCCTNIHQCGFFHNFYSDYHIKILMTINDDRWCSYVCSYQYSGAAEDKLVDSWSIWENMNVNWGCFVPEKCYLLAHSCSHGTDRPQSIAAVGSVLRYDQVVMSLALQMRIRLFNHLYCLINKQGTWMELSEEVQQQKKVKLGCCHLGGFFCAHWFNNSRVCHL